MMKLRNLLFLIAFTLLCTICYSQDYFIVENDTTFCSNLQYGTTMQGYLKSVRYTDNSGKEMVIEGRKNVPDVSTFYRQEVTIDKMPLTAKKPKSYIRYTPRVVDGKLKVYIKRRLSSSAVASESMTYAPTNMALANGSSSNGAKATMQQGGNVVGVYRFNIKFPNGVFYKINSKKNMKKHIKPYLQECAAFKAQYTGDYSTEEELFIEMIELYNSVCK